MKGVNYITYERGKKTAVVIRLKNYKEEIEDFLDGLDGLDAQNRAEEPSVDFEKAFTKILKNKTSNGKVSAKNKKLG